MLALTSHNPKRTEKLLSLQPVEEIWGVGRRISKTLNSMGITTALQLARANPVFIRKNFNVVLERTVRELNGESCISLKKPRLQNNRLSVVAASDSGSPPMKKCARLSASMPNVRQKNCVVNASTFKTSQLSSSPRLLRLMNRTTETWPLRS